MNELDIFSAALELADPAARSEYLNEACGEHSDRRERIEALLRNAAQASRFLESPPVAEVMTVDQPITEQPGTVIGPYRLHEQIGEGGFGVVYLAEQTEPVKRRVALKIIKPGMDTREVIARFEAERQALALMDHPNIAKVLDAGTTGEVGNQRSEVRSDATEGPSSDLRPLTSAGGRPYFVMELVKGISITDYCDQCHLAPRDRLQLFLQVCQAIQHAHQKGVIHRDVKPSNVLIAMQDGKPVPKVIDFGVAKAINQRLTEHTLLTRFAQVVGTPLYMSPEQAEMSPLDVDTRSDIYSLGVLLYELLTGTTPFERERLKEATFDEMRRIIREEEPLRPSARISTLGVDVTTIAEKRRTEPRKLQQVVRGDLDWIVMKALEKDRTRRYETASSLADDVERYLRDEPVQACPPSAGYRFRKFARRNKLALITTAGIAVSVIVLAISASITAVKLDNLAQEAAENLDRANDEKQHAVEAAERAELERARADAVVQFLVNDLLGSAAPDRAQGRDVTVDEVLANADARIAEAFSEQPLLEAAVRDTMGRAYSSLGDWDKAERHLARARDLRLEHLGARDVETLRTTRQLAWVIYRQANRNTPLNDEAKLRQVEQMYQELLARCSTVLGAEHPETIAVKSDLIAVLLEQDRRVEAADLSEDLIAIKKRDLGPDHPGTLSAMHNYGVLLRRLGRLEDARALYEEIMPVLRQRQGNQHPQTLGSVYMYANILSAQGQLEEARALYQQNLELRRSVLGDQHFKTYMPMYCIAGILLRQEKTTQAIALLEDALQRRPDDLFALYRLSVLKAHIADTEGHRQLREEILTRFSDTGDPNIAEQCVEVCALLRDSEAESVRLGALSEVALSQHPDRATCLLARGIAEYRNQDYAECSNWMSRALTAMSPSLQDEDRWPCAIEPPHCWERSNRACLHALQAEAYLYLAMAEEQRGHSEQAHATFATASAIIDDHRARIDEGELAHQSFGWMVCQIIRREAQQLLGIETAQSTEQITDPMRNDTPQDL